MLIIKRGDVLYADLGPVIGSEQDGIRPVLVLQNDIGNRFSPTVIVAPITTKFTKNPIPTHILIQGKSCGLRQDSIVLIEQIRTIDKARIIRKVGHISPFELSKIGNALKLSFSIRGNIFEFLDSL